MNEEKDMTQMTHERQHYARHTQPHSEESKSKISKTQQTRYDLMRKLIVKSQEQQMTEEKVKNICKEVVSEFIEKYAKLKTNKPTNINL